jgi:hypothetical protein
MVDARGMLSQLRSTRYTPAICLSWRAHAIVGICPPTPRGDAAGGRLTVTPGGSHCEHRFCAATATLASPSDRDQRAGQQLHDCGRGKWDSLSTNATTRQLNNKKRKMTELTTTEQVLGKLALEYEVQLKDKGWRQMVSQDEDSRTSRRRPRICPIRWPGFWDTSGPGGQASPCRRPPWSLERTATAMRRGPHKSSQPVRARIRQRGDSGFLSTGVLVGVTVRRRCRVAQPQSLSARSGAAARAAPTSYSGFLLLQCERRHHSSRTKGGHPVWPRAATCAHHYCTR